jgi:F0F1-type ATP synthase assembly protein I
MNNVYLKYSSLAFQMGATIGIFAYAGHWLDGHYHTTTPYYTIGLALVGVGIALYQAIKDFIKPTPK